MAVLVLFSVSGAIYYTTKNFVSKREFLSVNKKIKL